VLAVLTSCSDDPARVDDVAGPTSTRSTVEPTVEVVELIEVIDGDTLRVQVDGREERVRLIGINAPEKGECLADVATRRLRALTAGGDLRLERDVSDRDGFGRLLRYATGGSVDVNRTLVREGLAFAHAYPPDVAHTAALVTAQEQAQRAKRGLWSTDACGTQSTAALEIAHIEADAPGDDSKNLNEEWIEIANLGSTAVTMTRWTVRDESASHRFTFPDHFVLTARARVRIHSGCGVTSAGDLFWCETGSAVWNNDRDTGFLVDPKGNIVDRSAYVL
jgi:endonuclease YncB( thermonuclease family)